MKSSEIKSDASHGTRNAATFIMQNRPFMVTRIEDSLSIVADPDASLLLLILLSLPPLEASDNNQPTSPLPHVVSDPFLLEKNIIGEEEEEDEDEDGVPCYRESDGALLTDFRPS